LDINTLNTEEIKSCVNKWIKSVDKQRKEYDEKLLEVKNINFSYDENRIILEDISFDLYRGEILSLLGNNGAGKSTLSKVITGICKNSHGNIIYKGEKIDSWGIRKRGSVIGYVMQNPNHMITQETLMDEVAFGLKLRGYKKDEIEKISKDTLKTCGLYPYRNWPVTALSYGQKKRLTIASILALNPKILILDEPTAGQDHKNYLEFMSFIEKLTKKGISIIFITHDMHLALEYSNRAIVLSKGKILKDNLVSNVLSEEEILKKAHLSKLSISHLANILEIDESLLLETFINYDKNEVI
jgi:energy-coupling factor transport system ATP-binding protein